MRAAGFRQHLDHVVDRNLHLHEAGLHFDAIVAQNAPHARRLADVLAAARARLPRSCGGCRSALARIVLGGQHGGLEILAQFALGLGDAAAAPVRSALRWSAPCAICRWSRCACSSNLASICSVRRSSSFSLADSRFSHSRAISFSRARQFGTASARSVRFERLRLFEAPVQFAQETR